MRLTKRRRVAIGAAALFSAAAVGLSVAAAANDSGTARADQATIPATVAGDQPISVLSGPGSGSPVATAQPGTGYQVLCTTQDWAKIQTGPLFGFLPIKFLTLPANGPLTDQVPDCSSTAFKPGPVPSVSESAAVQPARPLPYLPPITQNKDDQGPGEACVFDRPGGAAGAGHIGWGFDDPKTAIYRYGSTESVPGGPFGMQKPYIKPGDPGGNGEWDRTGFRSMMLAAFRDYNQPGADPGSPTAKPYTRYRCQSTLVSNVAAANAAVETAKAAGYCVVITRNNCLDHAISILTAYGAAGMPSPLWLKAVPNNWFDTLPAPWGPVQNL